MHGAHGEPGGAGAWVLDGHPAGRAVRDGDPRYRSIVEECTAEVLRQHEPPAIFPQPACWGCCVAAMGTPSRSAGSSLQSELANTRLSLIKQQQHHGLRSEGRPRRLRLHRQGASHHGPCWILQGLLNDVGRRAGSDRDAYRLVENPARPARPCWRLGAILAVTLFSNVGWRMLGHALGHERCLEPPDNATATASCFTCFVLQVQRQQAVRPAAARRLTTKAISDVNLVVGGAWTRVGS